MTEKYRRIVEMITVAIVFLIIVPTLIEVCPDGNFPSVVEWWDSGNAQLTLACRDYLDSGSGFWGDDFISNLFANYSRWVAGYAVSSWNALVRSWYGKLILLAVSALLSGFIYDLLKYLVRKLYLSARNQKG